MLKSYNLGGDYLSGDSVDRDAFMQEAEDLLNQSQFQSALDHARKRSMLLPGDIDAQIVMGRALSGMGLQHDAGRIIEDITEKLEKWSSAIRDLQNVMQLHASVDILNATNQKILSDSPNEELKVDEAPHIESEDPMAYQADPEASDPSVVLEAFYTPTMAELFMHQGHIDMAYEIYSGLVKKHPGDIVFKNRLRDLETLLQNRQTKEDPEKRSAIIDELERWVTKIKKPL